MMNWKEVVSKMGLDPEELGEETKQRLKDADYLARKAGGRIHSRQIVATILIQEQPNLAAELAKDEGHEEFTPMVNMQSVERRKAKWQEILQISDRVQMELLDSYDKFPDFNSRHEGYAVIKEELEELWDEVKQQDVMLYKLEEEATQVAAMAMKFLLMLNTMKTQGPDQ